MVRHRPQTDSEQKQDGRGAGSPEMAEKSRRSSTGAHRSHSVEGSESMLVFRANTVTLGIPAHFVDGLHAPPQSTPVPLAPSYIAGVAILRGEVVPLLDVAKFLELEQLTEVPAVSALRQRGTSFERVAVVAAAGMQVGILCGEVRGIIPVALTVSQDGRVTKGRMLDKVVARELSTDDGVLVVLDVPKLLEEARVKL